MRGFVVYIDCATFAVAGSTTWYKIFCAVISACIVFDEVVCLGGFVATAPVAVWVAV